MNINEISEFLNNYWYKKQGLVAAQLAVICFSATLLATLSAPFNIWIYVLLIELVSIFLIWIFGQRWPRVRKDKAGFVVSFNCSDPDEALRIQEDFVTPLKKLILSGELGKSFDFIVLPQHLAKKIVTSEDAIGVRLKMRAHFMIFGDIKNRTINGKQHHMFDMHGTVAHLPVPADIAADFTHQFSTYLPRKLQISTDNDVIALEFTSEWADLVARYIIANAAMFSGDLIYAEQLLLDARQKLETMDTHFPIYRELNKNIPLRLTDLYEALAMLHHRKWAEEFDDGNIRKVQTYIDKVPAEHAQRKTIVILKAICEFWINRNLKISIERISSLRKKFPNDPLIDYNLGFLYAYEGNLKLAIRHYRKACSSGVENEALFQIEEFINKVLLLEPHKFQLHYCLGFFNKEAKGDSYIAEEHLSKFIASCPAEMYTTEKALAHQWIEELSKSA